MLALNVINRVEKLHLNWEDNDFNQIKGKQNFSIMFIGIAPITQLRIMCVMKIVDIQGKQHLMREYHEGLLLTLYSKCYF